jgi:uncharacterized protein (TIGR00369 family)
MTISPDPVPPGFTEMAPFGPFHALVGPMFEMIRDGRSVIGLRVGEKHRNLGSAMHGGMFLMLADTAMTHAAARARPPEKNVVTTALSSEIMAPAQPGDWVEAEVEVMRAGRSVIFLNCLIRRDGPSGKLLVRSSSTFQVIEPRSA